MSWKEEPSERHTRGLRFCLRRSEAIPDCNTSLGNRSERRWRQTPAVPILTTKEVSIKGRVTQFLQWLLEILQEAVWRQNYGQAASIVRRTGRIVADCRGRVELLPKVLQSRPRRVACGWDSSVVLQMSSSGTKDNPTRLDFRYNIRIINSPFVVWTLPRLETFQAERRPLGANGIQQTNALCPCRVDVCFKPSSPHGWSAIPKYKPRRIRVREA